MFPLTPWVALGSPLGSSLGSPQVAWPRGQTSPQLGVNPDHLPSPGGPW